MQSIDEITPSAWMDDSGHVISAKQLHNGPSPLYPIALYTAIDLDKVRRETWERVLADPCVQKLEPDEPFFVLLGRDEDAAKALARWIRERESREGISPKTDAAFATFQKFGAFRRARAAAKGGQT